MRNLILAAVLFLSAVPALTHAQDIREAARKAEADRSAARAEAVETEAQIIADRAKLLAEVERLEQEQAQLEQSIKDLQSQQVAGNLTRTEMADQWSERELGFREISGNVRVAARDLESLLKASPLDAGQDWRLEKISPLLDTGYFPDIDDITGMTHVFLDEISRSGHVSVQQGSFVGRDGLDTKIGRAHV